MSHWNYRVVRRIFCVFDETSYDFGIHEAHYGDDSGRISMITAEPVQPYGETPEELKRCLALMYRALDKPVLDYETREEIPA